MGRRDQSGKYLKKKSMWAAAVLAVLLCLSALVIVGMLWHRAAKQQDFRELAEQVREYTEEPSETTTEPVPSTGEAESRETVPEPQPEILPQYRELYAENPDFFGWITIPDTKIDYPVMHTPEDPEKYLHMDFYGAYSYAGTLFADAKCGDDSDNLLIYGHNMKDGSMFRSLMKYEQKNYWKEHPTIVFNTLYEEGEYEVLAAFYDRVYYKAEDCFKFYKFINAANEAEFDDAVAYFQSKALYDTGVTASYGDRLITLVTCSYHTENGRFVVVARKQQT